MKPACLITGAGKRIGKAMSLFLAQQGYDCGLHYHSSEKEVRELAEQIRVEYGVNVTLFQADLSKLKETERLMSEVKSSLPHLSVMIHNASWYPESTFHGSSMNQVESLFRLHTFSPYYMSQQFLSWKKQTSGLIVFMLDSAIHRSNSIHFPYLLSKKATWKLMEDLSLELAPEIRVNGIAPGPILPPPDMSDREYMKQRSKRNPLKTTGSPNQITRALGYLIDQDFETGEVLHVDGGEYLL